MVILYGLGKESPVELIGNALEDMGQPFLTINHHNISELNLSYSFSNGVMTGEFSLGDTGVALESITGIYYRPVHFSVLRQFKDWDPASAKYQNLHQAFTCFEKWIDLFPAKVLNRRIPMLSNSSKPYQMMLIKQSGFSVPGSLISNRQQDVQAFAASQGSLIYKSASSVRSIVNSLDSNTPLSGIAHCPVLFQQKLEGTNYRVHVVHDQVFATKILTDATDYRYAHKQQLESTLSETTIPGDIQSRCIALAALLELPLAGIDLMHCHGRDEWFCFEVNPSPGYSFYEKQTGQPIAKAIATYLSAAS